MVEFESSEIVQWYEIISQENNEQCDSSDDYREKIQRRGSPYPTNSDYINWFSIPIQVDLVPHSIDFYNDNQ